MAASVSIVDGPKAEGNKYVTIADVTLDSSYPTGGEAVTANDFKLSKIEYADADIFTPAGSVNQVTAKFDAANLKILIYDETPAQVANTSDLSNVVVRVKAVGV